MADDFSGMPADFMDQIRALVAQQLPTDAERKQALNVGLLQGSLGLLANVRKPFLVGLGEGGQAGLLGYQGAIQQQQDMKQKALAQAGQLYGMAKQASMMDMGMRAMNTPDQPMAQVPGTGMPSLPPGSFATQGQAPGGTPGMFAAGGQPSPSAPINQAQYAPGGNPFPSWQSVVPNAQKGAALASGDFKKIADIIGEGNKLTVGRNGELVMGNMLVGRAQGEGTIIYPGGDVSKAYYIGSPPEALAATANQAGAVKGKETAAAEAAKFPYDIRTITGPDRKPITDFTSRLLGNPLSGAPAGGGPSGGSGNINVNLQNGTRADLAAITRDVAAGGAAPARTAGGMVGPDPVETAGKEAYAKESSGMLVGREKEINEAGRNGAFASARWSEMQKLGTQFDSGALTPYRAKIAATFNALGADPDTVKAVAGGSLPAMEGFGKLSFESALNQIKSFSTRPAAQEVVLALQNNPNISMTVQGRNLLMATNKALADYNVQMMKDMAAFRRINGTTEGFEAAYYDSHPPEAILPTQAQIEQAVNGTPIKAGKKVGGLDAQALVDEARKRGLIK